MNTGSDALDNEVARRTAQGWVIVWRSEADAQLRRPKQPSFVLALASLLFFGVGFLVYLLYYWTRKDQLLYLRVVDGCVVATYSGPPEPKASPTPRRNWRGDVETALARRRAMATGAVLTSLAVALVAPLSHPWARYDQELRAMGVEPGDALGQLVLLRLQKVELPRPSRLGRMWREFEATTRKRLDQVDGAFVPGSHLTLADALGMYNSFAEQVNAHDTSFIRALAFHDPRGADSKYARLIDDYLRGIEEYVVLPPEQALVLIYDTLYPKRYYRKGQDFAHHFKDFAFASGQEAFIPQAYDEFVSQFIEDYGRAGLSYVKGALFTHR